MYYESSEEEAVKPTAAAESISRLLPGGDTNYSVGLLENGDLIISKVNGVTAATQAIKNLGLKIDELGLAKGRNIYLAQKFNTSVGSNHAEMCIMAAARKLGLEVLVIYCSGPHCGFCSAMMDTMRIELGNSAGSENQMGWSHPFVPLNYGQQLESSVQNQLDELKELSAAPEQREIVYGKWGFTEPKGKYTIWYEQ